MARKNEVLYGIFIDENKDGENWVETISEDFDSEWIKTDHSTLRQWSNQDFYYVVVYKLKDAPKPVYMFYSLEYGDPRGGLYYDAVVDKIVRIGKKNWITKNIEWLDNDAEISIDHLNEDEIKILKDDGFIIRDGFVYGNTRGFINILLNKKHLKDPNFLIWLKDNFNERGANWLVNDGMMSESDIEDLLNRI